MCFTALFMSTFARAAIRQLFFVFGIVAVLCIPVADVAFSPKELEAFIVVYSGFIFIWAEAAGGWAALFHVFFELKIVTGTFNPGTFIIRFTPQLLQTNIIIFTIDVIAFIDLTRCRTAVRNRFSEIIIITVVLYIGTCELLAPLELDAFIGVLESLVMGIYAGAFYSTFARAAIIHHFHEVHIVTIL